MQFEVIDANTVFGPSPTPAMDLSFDVLVNAIHNHGIAKACTLSTIGFCHNHIEGNEVTLAACEDKQELIPVATIDPRGFFDSSDDIAKIAAQPFRMFRFFPDRQGWPVHYVPFLAALDKIQPTGLPVMISIEQPGAASALMQIARGRQNAFILTSVPYEGIAEAVAVVKRSENIFLETHSLVSSGALSLVVKEVGAEKVIFGSGCPGASLAGALRQIQAAELDDADKIKILAGNIKGLLRI